MSESYQFETMTESQSVAETKTFNSKLKIWGIAGYIEEISIIMPDINIPPEINQLIAMFYDHVCAESMINDRCIL